MSAQDFLKLFEQNWSQRPIFKKDKDPLSLNEKSQEKVGEVQEEEKAVKNIPVSFLERAMTDDTMMTSSKTSLYSSLSDELFLSPRSVLNVKANPMKLQTILSGKEVKDFSSKERLSNNSKNEQEMKKKKVNVRSRRGKSMSDLEYEELKGFIDLGFVFSEEDHKDSNLVSILPGLQRLVKTVEEEEEDENRKPYLSEAWEHLERRKGRRQSTSEIKWNVPAVSRNKVDFKDKDKLKLWAHAVASTIRSS